MDEDSRSVSAVDFQRFERLYSYLYLLCLEIQFGNDGVSSFTIERWVMEELSDLCRVPETAGLDRTPALTDFWGTSEDAGILRALCTQ